MSKQENFIEVHLGEFLRNSRNASNNLGPVPPNSKEVENLIDYLKGKGLDPIIVGAVAVYSHIRQKNKYPKISSVKQLNIAISEDQDSFRRTQDIDLFISKKLPPPPPLWRIDRESIGVPSWISPSNGYVDFL